MKRNWISGRRVLRLRSLSPEAYVLRFERLGMDFKPGQHLSVGVWGQRSRREYSVYSAPEDQFLEILVKEVQEGEVSRQLRKLKIGDEVDVQGPFGGFTIPPENRGLPHLFIATGTGISPFHSMVKSYPNLNYTLLHGVRTLEETYEHGDFEKSRTISCVSRQAGGDFHGRVTEYLKTWSIDPQTQVYLCGNCAMIYDAFDHLKALGLGSGNIHTEVYF